MDESILYANACVRKESRTRRLAEKLLAKLDRPADELIDGISRPGAVCQLRAGGFVRLKFTFRA
jgi:hypothetical protein